MSALVLLALFASLFTPASLTSTAFAASPTINYQGKLMTSANVAVPNGTYNMRFWIIASPSAATSTALWTESLTSANRVQVTNGLFSVMLGSTTPLTGIDFSQTPLYLGVEIGGTGGSPTWDGEMLPRKIIGTVPAAFYSATSTYAQTASTSNLLSGIASSSFLRSDQADDASGLLTFTGGLISTASSTINNLTITNATTTALVINGSRFTSLTGTGLVNTGGVLTVSTSSLGFGTLASLNSVDISSNTNLTVSATGLTLSNDDIALTAGYSIPLTASTTEWAAASASTTALTPAYLRGLFSNTATGLTYNSGTGATSLTAGYNIPLTASTTEWANKVSSQWTTSGANISYSAGSVGIGTNPSALLHVSATYAAPVGGIGSSTVAIFSRNNTANGTSTISILSRSSAASGINFGSENAERTGFLDYVHAQGMIFGVGASERMRINGSGFLGIGTTTPSHLLTVAGDANITGALRFNGNAGTSGYVLQSTGTGAQWVATSTLGFSSAAITSLNGQTGATQTFATGTATGIGLTVTSVGNVHTFTPTVTAGYNIPLTASTTEWASTRDTVSAGSASWNAAAASTTALTPAYLRGLFSNTATGLTYNSGTGATSLTAGYNIPLTASTTEWANKVSSQWVTTGSHIYYNTGNVGVGTTTPYAAVSVGAKSGTDATDGSRGVDPSGLLVHLDNTSSKYAAAFVNDGANNAGVLIKSINTQLNVVNQSNVSSLYVNAGKVGMSNTNPYGTLSVGDLATSSITDGSIQGGALLHVRGSASGAYAAAIQNNHSNSHGLLIQAGSTNSRGLVVQDYTGSTTYFGIYGGKSAFGTSSPKNTLDIVGAAVIGSSYGGVNTAPSDGLLVEGNVGIGTTTPSAKLAITGTAGIGDIFAVASSTNARLFTVKSSGNVGIGTQSPASKLTIYQSSYTATEGLTFDSTDGNAANNGIFRVAASQIAIKTGGTDVYFDAGDIRSSSGFRLENDTGASTTPTYTFNGDANTGMYNPSADALSFSTGGLDRVRITSAGNVGIGTTSPPHLLTVAGDTNITGALRFNGNSGTAGQVLISNGASAPTWTATSSLGLSSVFSNSAQLAALLSDETGTAGNVVFSGGPTFTGNTTLANASTTNLTVSTNSYLGTVQSGTWNGSAVDISSYTNLSVSATGLSLSGDAVALTAGYNIPLTASTTNWNSFWDAPSSRITAGTGFAWSGNTFGAAAGYSIPLTASTTEWATTRNTVTAGSASWNAAAASTTALTPAYLRGLFSNTATGLTYNSGTGATSLTAG